MLLWIKECVPFNKFSNMTKADSVVKNLLAMQEMQVRSLGREIPWRRAWQSTPVFSPGESYGHRSLAGYGP